MLKTNNNAAVTKIIQEELLEWFRSSKRDLPFRQTKNPYAIWISEIMAQQTQIDTLIPYYNRFIKKFPDVKTLAQASEDSVIKAWEGLGYYSRARNLHKAAKKIMKDYRGIFPKTFKELIMLPGIGPYTGGAIASIAFNERVTAVDGNVLRVISRYCNSFFDIGEEKTKKIVTQWVEKILPQASGDFNEALMELGAMICSPKNPKCLICPIQKGCQSYNHETTDTLPIKKKKQKQLLKKMEVGILNQGSNYYFVRRPKSGLFSEMWSFPIIETSLGQGLDIKKKLQEEFLELSDPIYLGNRRHVFSHVIWEMSLYAFTFPIYLKEPKIIYKEPKIIYDEETPEFQFKSLKSIDDLALPVAFSKLLPLVSVFDKEKS